MKRVSTEFQGKCAVITGATSGIGRATAFALGKLGANLILVSRNRVAGEAMVKRLASSTPTARFEFIAADLSSLAQVRVAAAEISARCATIDLLINNAGARFDHYERTAEGNERTFATNHLGHFLLTGLLLERLAACSTARIINVTSSAAAQTRCDGPWQFDSSTFDRRQAYAKSKLANLLFTAELARRLEGGPIQCFAADPGVVATRFASNNGLLAWIKHVVSHGRKLELQSASAGADTIIYLASSANLPAHTSGKCYRNRQPTTVSPTVNDSAARAVLWEVSVTLTGIDPSVIAKETHEAF